MKLSNLLKLFGPKLPQQKKSYLVKHLTQTPKTSNNIFFKPQPLVPAFTSTRLVNTSALNSNHNLNSLMTNRIQQLLMYGIKEEDKLLWEDLITTYGDAISVEEIVKAKKTYLFTHVIGNPNIPVSQRIPGNSAYFSNTALHSKIANSHDESIITLKHLIGDTKELLLSSNSGTYSLLGYYESKLAGTTKNTSEIEQAIGAKDIEGKTPLLLACKTVNQAYAIRLIKLDINKKTINLNDNIEQRTPLHIACILGLEKVVKELINHGANTGLTDEYNHTAFYYLTCDESEKKQHIAAILDSVDFFYGRYFNTNHKEQILQTLLEKNNALMHELGLASIYQNSTP